MRLRHGGLGGVMDFSSWEARLQTAPNIGPLVSQMYNQGKLILFSIIEITKPSFTSALQQLYACLRPPFRENLLGFVR